MEDDRISDEVVKKLEREIARLWERGQKGDGEGEDKGEPYRRPDEMASALMEKMNFITTTDNEEMFVYENGVFRSGAEAVVREWVASQDPTKTRRFSDEVIFSIKSRTYRSRTDFNPDIMVVPVMNGLLNLETRTLSPFTPEKVYTFRIPVFFDVGADCANFKKFLTEVLNESDIPVIQELFGYCLLRDYRFQKAFMFVGDGANGKSTLIEILRRFLGAENVSTVPLQELTTNRFAPGRLYQKLVNVFSDLPSKALQQTGLFKVLCGGDTIMGEKKFKESFSFRNYAKLIFSCNQLPRAEDDSTAFYRRWILITFPNTFIGDRADKNIVEKIVTEQELSGILNWSLEGLKRLLERGEFSKEGGPDEIREQYERLSDPLKAFVADEVIEEEGEVITKEDFYSAYADYCRKSNLPVESKTAVGRRLPSVLPVVRADDRAVVRGRVQRVWKNIKLKVSEPGGPSSLEKFGGMIDGG